MSFAFTANSFKGWDDDGLPLVGGKLYTWISGTTTPKATFADSALTTTNTNPVVLNARGEAQVRLDAGAYSFALFDANDVQVGDTVDGISDGSEDVDELRGDLLDPDIGARIVQYNEETTVYDRLSRFKNPVDDFGAVGDGITDDTTAIAAALNSGDDMDGAGMTYAISSTIIISVGNKLFTNFNFIAVGGTLNATTPAFSITGPSNRFRDCVYDGGKFAAGFECVGGHTHHDACEIRRFKGYGIWHNAGGFGDMRVTGCEIYEYSNGDTEFATDSNYTAEGVKVSRADSVILGNIIRWCKTLIHFYSGATATMVGDCHLYNGGAAVMLRDHPRLFIVDDGADDINISDCYLEDGCIDLYSPSVVFWGNKCGWNSTRASLDYWIGVYANGQTGPYQLRAEGWQLATLNLSDGTIPFFSFLPYLANVWNGDYAHYQASPGVHNVGENMNYGRLQTDSDPVMRLFTPAGAGVGAGVTMYDSATATTDDTLAPGIWSAGNLVRLKAQRQNVTTLTAAYSFLVSDSGDTFICDTTAGAFTVKIPAAAPAGWFVNIRQRGAAVVTVDFVAGGTFIAHSGAAPYTTTNNLDQIEALVHTNAGSAPVVHLRGDVA